MITYGPNNDRNAAGLRKLADLVASGAQVKVGVPAGTSRSNGRSQGLIAAVHEFGAPSRNIPARPFLRPSIIGSKDQIGALNARNLKRIARDQTDVGTALGQLGVFAVGQVKVQIRSGNFAPLSPRTIARKKSSRPLIDSGQLVQSITYRAEVGTR